MASQSMSTITGRDFTVGLCYPTVINADLLELFDAAATAGFDTVTVSPGLYRKARNAGRSDEDLRRELRHRGLSVAVIDPLIGPLPSLPSLETASLFLRELLSYTEADCFAAAEALGAPLVAVAQPAGGPAEIADMVDVIGGIATRAADRGLLIGVEFISNSGGIGSLETARDIVRGVGLASVGLILDVWHIFRTGVELDALADIPGAEISVIQISDADASKHGIRPGVMEDRMLPGEGAIPLQQILATLLGNREGVDVGVEVFSQELGNLDPIDVGRRAADSVRKVLAGM